MESKKSKKAKDDSTFLKGPKKKGAAKKHKPDWPKMLGDKLNDHEERIAALEGLVRSQNPTNLPPEDPPPQVNNEVKA